MKRTFIMILGLTGGLLGIFGSVHSLYLRDFEEQTLRGNVTEAVILYSVFAIIGAFLSPFKHKAGSWFMTFSAIAMIFTTRYTGVLGVMSLTLLVCAATLSYTRIETAKKLKKKQVKDKQVKKKINKGTIREVNKKQVNNKRQTAKKKII